MVKVDDYIPSCNDRHNFSRRVTLQQWPLRPRPPVAVRGIWNSIGFSWEMTNMCRGDSSSQKRTRNTNVSTDLGMSFFFSLAYSFLLGLWQHLPFVLIKLAKKKTIFSYASFLTGVKHVLMSHRLLCQRNFKFWIYYIIVYKSYWINMKKYDIYRL